MGQAQIWQNTKAFPPFFSMPLQPRRSFVALAATDFDTIVSFYQTLLGQTPVPFQPQRYAEFQLGGLSLAIFPPKLDQQAEFTLTSPGPLSLCLEVEDLEVAIAHLDQLHSPYGEILQASHGQECYAYDPQGNRLIIYQPKSSKTDPSPSY